MRNFVISVTGALCAAGVATAAAADPASPATFGSAAILTNRACTATPNGDCQLAPTRNFTQYAGGAGSAFSTAATNEANSGASGSAYASFTGSAVPTLGVASFSGAATRTGASAVAYQTFTYSGSAAIDLALSGTLHYVGSGTIGSSNVTGVEPGGRGFFGANLTVMPTSFLDDIGTSGQDVLLSLTPLNDCGAGVTGTAYSSSQGIGAGEHTIPLSLTTGCNGGALTIRPGQAFVVLATVQAISNQGGFLDASHTFTSFFDPTATVFTDTGQSVGAAFLEQSVVAVPEPAVWSLMILGFAATGAALRRRRATAVAA